MRRKPPVESAVRTGVTALLGILLAATPLSAFAEDAAPTSGYEQGFFLQAEDGSSTLKINGRVQARFTYVGLEGIDNGAEDEYQFSIPQARLKMSGHLGSKDVKYTFQADFGNGGASLKDFYVDFKLMPDWVHVRAGQWKRPFSRQQINSSGNLEFVDRALTDKAFEAGRDIGVAIHSDYNKDGFEYTAGLFNGTGIQSKTTWKEDDEGNPDVDSIKVSNAPDQFDPVAVVRLGYGHGGIKGYSEADLEGGGFRFAVGGSGLYDLDLNDSGDGAFLGEVDYAVKVNGFSSTGGFYTRMTEDEDGALAQDQMGIHAQVGYVIAEKYQPVVRFALIDPDGEDNNIQRITAGMNVYLKGHGLKWQTDLGIALYEAPEGADVDSDVILRSQLQLAF